MPSSCGRISIQTTKYGKKKAPGDLIETCRINEALPGVLGNKGHLCQVNKGTSLKPNGTKEIFGEGKMPIFQGYKGTGTPNSWEGLIDEALPCVGGGGGTCSIVSQNIFGFSLFPKLKIFCLFPVPRN